MVDSNDSTVPRNGFAMPFRDFVSHLMFVLDQLGMSLHTRTTVINDNLHAFSARRNIAYRFLSPTKIANAINISVTADPCIFTQLFLIFHGISDDDLGLFAETVGRSKNSKDTSFFRILETSVWEIT
ncbi:hypothetical protein EDD16DRAFT_1781968 [Pisolithus croceorrhizus]|nr:hypothetical protein EV401DRAFT_2144857 [Pisolithus croceorrhizus]KAI6122391.1 hypothetical protein EDD16DRAFT_1781968 [Pisolithus croceorrhizus]KAI6169044.1 hypothetical protein EDD17DRAFT_1772661 [Pisolithus thermaeus]